MTTVAQTPELLNDRRTPAVPASDSCRRHRSRFGLAMPAILVLACALLHLWPAASDLLEFNRTSIRQGQYWRLVTGQWLHFDWAHLLSDAGTCGVLYWVGWRRWNHAGPMVALCAIACGAAVYFAAPQVEVYRGLSGIGYGLLAWVLVSLARDARSWPSAGWMGLLALTAGKVLWDLTAGEPLLSSFLPQGVSIISAAHLAGLAVGAGMGLVPRPRPPQGPPGLDVYTRA